MSSIAGSFWPARKKSARMSSSSAPDMSAARPVYFLAEKKGANVTLTFIEPAIEAKFWMFKKYFQDKLAKDNVRVYPHVQFKEVTPKGVAIVTEDGKDVFLECDTVVLSTGSTPDTALQ